MGVLCTAGSHYSYLTNTRKGFIANVNMKFEVQLKWEWRYTICARIGIGLRSKGHLLVFHKGLFEATFPCLLRDRLSTINLGQLLTYKWFESSIICIIFTGIENVEDHVESLAFSRSSSY